MPEVYFGEAPCTLIWVIPYNNKNNRITCCNESEVLWYKELYALTWSIGSPMGNYDTENSWKFIWIYAKNQKVLLPGDYSCIVCSQGKLIIKPSSSKIPNKISNFLEWIQGDICGPIHPPSGPFSYFMVLVNASTWWSYICSLFSRNVTLAKLFA